ncbi:nucleotidyltransferase domain-containing protein [bacterium]|nr:nucleotidyltransferase domain-containing protein [bacterium]
MNVTKIRKPYRRDEVLHLLEENRSVLQELGVAKLSLIGSIARDETHENSDLDFLVTLRENTFKTFMDIVEYLENIFEGRVELITEEAVIPFLKPVFERERIDVKGFQALFSGSFCTSNRIENN